MLYTYYIRVVYMLYTCCTHVDVSTVANHKIMLINDSSFVILFAALGVLFICVDIDVSAITRLY